MIARFLTERDADTVVLDFDLFLAEQAKLHRVCQPAIIAALRPRITRSQPASPPVPAARTGEERSPSLNSSPVKPIPETSGAEAHGERNADEQSAAVKGVSLTADSQANAGGENEALNTPPPTDTDKTGEAPASPAPSRAEQLRALFADGRQPTCMEAVAALGYAGRGPANRLAKELGLTFRKVTTAELAEKGRAARAKQAKAYAERQNITTSRLATEVQAKPSPIPEQPPANIPDPPPVELDAADVLHRPRSAPTGRFYLVDRGSPMATPRYVHQSLQPASDGSGPLLTTDRKWAWFDNMDRYRGAKKRWPQIASMRKEPAHAH